MITVLGVDQSLTSTGLVVLDIMPHMLNEQPHIELVTSDAIKTVKLAEDMYTDTILRANKLADQVANMVINNDIKVICFESLSLASKGNATRTLPMVLGFILRAIREVVRDKEIAIYHIAPKSLKKLATGSGNASKEHMFDTLKKDCVELYTDLKSKPKNVGRYDICDAFYLAREGYKLHVKALQE